MYRIIGFGTTNLEHYNQVDTIGSGATPTSYFNLAEGGAVDGYGSAVKNPGSVERVKTIRLFAATEAALQAQFFGLLKLRGTRDKLYRRTVTNEIQWVYARLAELTASRTYELTRFKYVQDVELRFICQDATWRGDWSAAWTLNSGIRLNTGYRLDSSAIYSLASGTAGIDLTISADVGRATVRSILFNIRAGSAVAMTGVTIARTGGETLTYTGTIPINGVLAINTGTMRVTCTGVTNPYSLLTFASTADMAAWFTLPTGTVHITITPGAYGTGAQAEILYNEAWY